MEERTKYISELFQKFLFYTFFFLYFIWKQVNNNNNKCTPGDNTIHL